MLLPDDNLISDEEDEIGPLPVYTKMESLN